MAAGVIQGDEKTVRMLLKEANLYGANLHGADLQGSQLHEATFQHANLRDTNLTGTTGMVAAQLAGTCVVGARLPDALQTFAALRTVKVLVKQTRTLLILLLLGCALAWMIIASTTDAFLLTNAPTVLLPQLSLPIPSATLYHLMPLGLLLLFVYLHLHLHRLWEEVADLPAVFPDGRPLDRVAYPWLLHSVVRAHVLRLRSYRPPLSYWRCRSAVILVWWLLPSGADLRQADLRSARVEGAELFGANLLGADLSFATGLTRQQLTGTLLDATTRLPDEIGTSLPAFPSRR